MSQHEEIEGWLERSGQVLDENAQAMRVAAAEALLDRAFGVGPMLSPKCGEPSMIELLERTPEHLRTEVHAAQLAEYRRAAEVAAARRATELGIVDELSPEAMARVMASMREEFASASIAPVPPRPSVTFDDMVRAQRRRRQDRAERRSMFEQLCEQWRREMSATWLRRTGEPHDATRGGA